MSLDWDRGGVGSRPRWRIDAGTGPAHPQTAVAETDRSAETARGSRSSSRGVVAGGSDSLTAPFVAIAGFVLVLLFFGRYQPGLFMVLFLLGFPLLFGWATASLVRSKGGSFS